MQNKSKAGQNPLNISRHLNCRKNLHVPRLTLELTEFYAFICLWQGSGRWTIFILSTDIDKKRWRHPPPAVNSPHTEWKTSSIGRWSWPSLLHWYSKEAAACLLVVCGAFNCLQARWLTHNDWCRQTFNLLATGLCVTTSFSNQPAPACIDTRLICIPVDIRIYLSLFSVC